MANANVASMLVDALLKLREDIEKVLTRKAQELRGQLARLGDEVGPRTGANSLKGRSVPVKYRDKSGNTWAGRGAQPVWLREKLKGQFITMLLASRRGGGPNAEDQATRPSAAAATPAPTLAQGVYIGPGGVGVDTGRPDWRERRYRDRDYGYERGYRGHGCRTVTIRRDDGSVKQIGRCA